MSATLGAARGNGPEVVTRVLEGRRGESRPVGVWGHFSWGGGGVGEGWEAGMETLRWEGPCGSEVSSPSRTAPCATLGGVQFLAARGAVRSGAAGSGGVDVFCGCVGLLSRVSRQGCDRWLRGTDNAFPDLSPKSLFPFTLLLTVLSVAGIQGAGLPGGAAVGGVRWPACLLGRVLLPDRGF